MTAAIHMKFALLACLLLIVSVVSHDHNLRRLGRRLGKGSKSCKSKSKSGKGSSSEDNDPFNREDVPASDGEEAGEPESDGEDDGESEEIKCSSSEEDKDPFDREDMPASAEEDDGLPKVVIKNGEDGMISTTSQVASKIGARLLREGWSAADVLVSVQAILGLVEPSASGLGGGSFALYYDATTKALETYDGREKAPSAATEDRFTSVPNFFVAWQSGLSVGVPGTPRLLEAIHKKHGMTPWGELFEDVIGLAEEGFELDARQSGTIASLLSFNPDCENRIFFSDPTTFEYFVNPDCTAKAAGTILTNQEYADTVKAIRDGGADAFYIGSIADDIASAVQSNPIIPGDMTSDDIASYTVEQRDPVCIEYKENNVCGMGPPSSGGLAVSQMLGILENFDIEGNPMDADNVHLFTQAGRLAFADRSQYVGDSDFVPVPTSGMLDKDYLAQRAYLIEMGMDMQAEAGTPPGSGTDSSGMDSSTKETGTTHISIVDRYGNAVSVTSSIESPYGNGVMVHGFLLNNELTDFSFAPVDGNGMPIANRVEGNKRPRSSMSPSIIFDSITGNVKLLTGSPGGSRIIGYTTQAIWNTLEFNLNVQQAINIPHYQNRNDDTVLEEPIPGLTNNYDVQELSNELTNRGHEVNVIGLSSQFPLYSGLSSIMVGTDDDGTKLYGGADWRRQGLAA